MKEALFKINVSVTQAINVTAPEAEINMILFTGDFTSCMGSGVIMPGGVDTQKRIGSGPNILSARYCLGGADDSGRAFIVFIENEGVAGDSIPFVTTPTIYTNHPDYQWLNGIKLHGTVDPSDNGITILIYE